MELHMSVRAESDRAKPAHGGVKTKNFAQIVLIYAGLERSELASASAKQKQLIAAVFDALLPSRPWFCPRKPHYGPRRETKGRTWSLASFVVHMAFGWWCYAVGGCCDLSTSIRPTTGPNTPFWRTPPQDIAITDTALTAEILVVVFRDFMELL